MNSDKLKISEKALYEIWKKQDFQVSLKTISDEDVSILDPGTFNSEHAGPDFKNARIRIGNLTYVGDIEIDNDYSDWKTHGHNIDIKYSKVILHLSLYNSSGHAHVYSRDGRRIPSICFASFIDKKVIESLGNSIEVPKADMNLSLKCSSGLKDVDSEIIEKFLHLIGIQRFEKKCKKIFSRLKELQFINELGIKEPVISYELTSQFESREFSNKDFSSREVWQQLLYEMLFEALGYSKNKTQMFELAKSANIDFLNKIENDGVLIEKYEAVLFYISGLIDSDKSISDKNSIEYIERISLHWNSIRSFYDGKYMENPEWHFFRLRPQNFPTVRIAGGARILKYLLHGNLIQVMERKISEIQNLTVLINSLRTLFVIKAEGFWKDHYVFNEKSKIEIKYFVGASRADEIIVNVVLPFFAVYFEVFGKANLSKKIIRLYDMYELRSENQIIYEVASGLNIDSMMKRAILAQGMIDLFRNYCSKNKCLECEIGRVIFN